MTPQELKAARQAKGWTQQEASTRLRITQPYLHLLETGRRRLTPPVLRRAFSVYGLSPQALPIREDFVLSGTSDEQLAAWLAKLNYPGFAYLMSHTAATNPQEVLLRALAKPSLDARVAEALPWLALEYAGPDLWLVETARKFNLQNKLGFVVRLAERVAETHSPSRTENLNRLEGLLEESRLAKEDFFYRPPRTESERNWLLKNRTDDAAHWNLLTDMRLERLSYAR